MGMPTFERQHSHCCVGCRCMAYALQSSREQSPSTPLQGRNVVLESLGAIKRAGADLIFSYFALDLAEQKVL